MAVRYMVSRQYWVNRRLGLFLHIPVVALAVGICGTVADAAPLCVTAVTNPSSFRALGAVGCQFGSATYFNFDYSFTTSDAAGNLLSNDTVGSSVAIHFSDPGGQGQQPVVDLLSTWAVTNGETGDIRINYDLSAPPS